MTATTQSKYLRPIRKGEYDLVNISLVGHDPADGRPYEACHAEWQASLDDVVRQADEVRWWQFRRHLRIRWQTMALTTHLGMH